MKPVTRVLTPAAQDDADEFYIRFADRGCTCFLSPPCSHCLHHGNPLNLECDDAAWIEVAAVTQSRNKREGKYAGWFDRKHSRSSASNVAALWPVGKIRCAFAGHYRSQRRMASLLAIYGLADKPGEA